MTREWSHQQGAVFNWFVGRTLPKNLVVRARAGTGKTTTLLEGVNRAPEGSILVAAFNKRIQLELEHRVENPRAEAKTLHGVGMGCVRRFWTSVGVDNQGKRAQLLADRVCGQQAPDPIKKLVARLCTKGREMAPLAQAAETLMPLAVRFDLVPDDVWTADGFGLDYVAQKALEAMVIAAMEKPVATGMDYADMLFLPIRNKWLRPRYDLVVVDEAQDMNETQLTLALGVVKPEGRVCIIGDDRQGIYGFRGADTGSLDRLKGHLKAAELPLTTTYRCARSIVAVAKKLVPDFEAGPTNPEGVVREGSRETLFADVRPGDFVLSRKNAPLVGVALALIRRGVRTKIEGKDIGAGLKAVVQRLASGAAKHSIPAWLEKLGNWRDKEVERAMRVDDEGKAEEVRDRYETLLALADGVAGVPELFTRVDNLFADVETMGAQVVCSSVHRAKGLEADRVFILRDTLNMPVACRHCRKRPGRQHDAVGCESYEADPAQRLEEQNIEYVAVTRAKHELVWIAGDFAGRR